MKLKHWATALICLASLNTALAQAPGYQKIAQTASIQQALAKQAQETKTIESDFTQVKHMKMLNEKMNAKGKFYFKQASSVRIEYTQPYQYLLVMTGNAILVKENGKVSKINTKNSLTMQSVNRIMMDCMRGTVFANKDFVTTAYGSGSDYLLSLKPVSNSMKGLFSEIEVYVNKKDNQVTRLVMKENGGDYTEMKFVNRKLNTNLADALFSVR